MKHNAAETAATATDSAAHAAHITSGINLHTILNSPDTWLIVAFLLFIAIFLKVVYPMIGRGLDKRADDIRYQLEQAGRLRAQAQALLASYEAERLEKLKEAEEIIASAKRDADALRARTKADLKQMLERRSQQAMEKIERAEKDAVAHIRSQMVEAATAAVRDIVRNKLDGGAEDPSIAKALRAIESSIH